MDRLFGAKPPITVDLDQMPETPHRGSHHRRAHSDTSFRFDDLLLFDPSDLDLSAMDLPSPSPALQMAVDCSDDSSSGPNPPRPRSSGPINHLRSLSVDSDFFDTLSLAPGPGEGEKSGGRSAEKGVFHRHSISMDGSSSSFFEADSMMGVDDVKKAMGADKLSELALIDPKRAKRILANRQSAARSKERKVRYTGELERKVHTLQTEATTLSAQVTMLQRDTSGLTTENKELKMRLQALEQQAQLRDALNEALREEVQRLKIATGQIPAVNGSPFNRGHPHYSHQPAFHQFGNQQQLHMPQQSNNQPHARFSDFTKRV